MPESGIIKYHVKIKFEVEGVVEKADLIGAIFGQTEGLFGPEMNLHELQKNWKVGRIEIKLESKNGRTNGEVLIPMGTDMSTVSLIAAAIENIDKVGPCSAKFHLEAVDDIRAIRRKAIAERAKAIMKEWASKTSSESEEILKEVTASTKPARLITYGKDNLPAGPGIYLSNDIYLVEGRADVINLLRAGVDNVIAIEGTKVPESIIKLSKEKNITAFLDGDRGGDLIQKELSQVIKAKKVFRAPSGKEVEDLTPVEILRILKPTVAEEKLEEAKPAAPPPPPKIPQPLLTKIKEIHPKINGTLEAVILDGKMKKILQVPVNQLVERLSSQKNAKTVIFDGIVTQRLIDICESLDTGTIVGHRVGNLAKKPTDTTILTFEQLGLD
ncbi:MAG: DNA primase DnaG [Nitrososphaerales archaeon]